MLQNISKKKFRSHYIPYTICFIFIAIISFGYFFVLKKTFIYNIDAFLQHYPLLVKMRHIVGDFLRGNGFSFWSADIGIGADSIGNLSIVLCDPFNYIAAAFPVKYIDVGYSVACILRLYAAGLAMASFLKYHKCSADQCVLGGISYAFCSWAIGVLVHGFFMNPLILFPLLILGIDKVFDHRSPCTLIFSIVASLITYVYFAYMSAIFAAIYILIRYILGETDSEKSLKDFFKRFFQFFLYVAVACCIAAPILLPMLFTLLNAAKTSGVDYSFTLTLREIFRYIPSLLCNNDVSGNYSYTGVNSLLTLMVPLMFLKLRDRKTRVPIILFFFCFLMTAFPLWGRLMNAFSYSVGRWCYILAFFYVWASITCLNDFKNLNDSQKKLCITWTLFLAVLILCSRVFTPAITTANAAIGLANVAFMLLFLLGNHLNAVKQFILLIFNIGISYLLMFSPYCGDAITNYLDIGQCYAAYNNSVLRAYHTIDDPDYFRVDFNEHILPDGKKYPYANTPANENLFWASHTLSGYLSTLDSNISQFNKDMANAGATYRRMCTYSNDNRCRLNFLEDVKYFLTEHSEDYAGYGYEKIQSHDGVQILKAKSDSALGYVYTSVMPESEYNTYSSLNKEQLLMQYAILEDDLLSSINSDTLSASRQTAPVLDTAEVPYQISSASSVKIKGNSFNVTASSDKLVLTIPKCRDSELYLLFKGLEKTPYTLKKLRKLSQGSDKNNSAYDILKFNAGYMSYHPYGNFTYYVKKDNVCKRVINAAGEAQGITDNTEYLTNIGYFSETEGEITITFEFLGKYSFEDLKIYAVSSKNFAAQAKALSNRRFTVTSQSSNTIKGIVNTDKNGVLYLSLPYHPGWQIYIDGKKEQLYCINTCFIGTDITAGEHKITLTYRPFGFKPAILLFCIGIPSLLIIIMSHYRKQKNKQ